MTTQSVLAEVGAERTRQDAQWGGEERDDALPLANFVQLARIDALTAEISGEIAKAAGEGSAPRSGGLSWE